MNFFKKVEHHMMHEGKSEQEVIADDEAKKSPLLTDAMQHGVRGVALAMVSSSLFIYFMLLMNLKANHPYLLAFGILFFLNGLRKFASLFSEWLGKK